MTMDMEIRCSTCLSSSNKGILQEDTEDLSAGWSSYWCNANEKFEAEIAFNPDLATFQGKMFFMWEGTTYS
jgi:hypothetical protein